MYTSSITSFRVNSSPYFPFNECSCYSNERIKSPSCCCSCCCSCTKRVPGPTNINPSLLYGLRQSSLLGWSFSRRVVSGVGWSMIGDAGCRYNGGSIGRRIGKGRYGVRVWEEGRGVGDTEAVLSLLIEDVGEECLDVREQRRGGSGKLGRFVERVKVVDDGCYEGRKGKVVSDRYRSDIEHRVESSDGHFRGKDRSRRGDEESLGKGVQRRSRRGRSSSLYFSSSELGDYESDQEVEVGSEESVEEALIGRGKDPRKRAGINVRREGAEEYSRKHRDERYETYEDKQCDDVKVRNSAQGDLRKRSEKKLEKKSIHETALLRDSVSSRSQISGSRDNISAEASTSRKQHNYRGDVAVGDKDLLEEPRTQSMQSANQVSGYSNSSLERRLTEEAYSWDAATTSTSGRKLTGSEKTVAACDYCRTCGCASEEDLVKRISKERKDVSEIRATNSTQNSSVERQSESRIRKMEESTTLHESTTKEANERQHEASYQATTGQVNSRQKSQNYSEAAYHGDEYAVTSSNSQRQTETRTQDVKGTSLLHSSQDSPEMIGQQYQVAREVKSQRVSKQASKDVRDASVVEPGKEETVAISQTVSQQRAHCERSSMTSKVNRVEEIIEKHEETDERSAVIKDLRHPIRQATLPASRVDTGGKSSRFPMTPPSSQLVERDPLYVEPVTIMVGQGSRRTSEGGSSSFVDAQSRSPSSRDEADGNVRRMSYAEAPEFFSHEDALGSAERMEISSSQIVGEFVEQIRLEASTSQKQTDKVSSEIQSVHEVKKLVQRKSKKHEDGKSKVKKQDSRSSSWGSGTKGSLDGTRDGSAQSVPVPASEAASNTTTAPGNAVERRHGRSLWNIVGDIFLLRWVGHAETQKSTAKSTGQSSSSNESAGCEAWFSGNEPDDPHNGNTKGTKLGSLQEPTPADLVLKKESHTQSQRKGLTAVSLTETATKVEADVSVSLGSSRISSESGAIPGEAVLETNVGRQTTEPATSGNMPLTSATLTGPAGILGQVVFPPDVFSNFPLVVSTHIESHGMEEISEGGSTQAAEGAVEEELEHRVDGDNELKRRKFQRKDQLVRERFDKWEEAYRQESKQRKIDEIFMREALVEAKKAADTWEVPVGAVLVQNGKIIARGYNLVEELRDSTAHAEMICIREASKVLKSWRLSEATLYVTLEPCPMCAGAILQARIDTVVWGAPNKLLGADGSWIRLFPVGGEGDGRSESSDKPAAPVHPFHPNITIRRGVLEAECADAMQQFFQLRRKKEKKVDSPPEQPSCLPIPHHPSKMFLRMPNVFHLLFCL